MGTALWASSSVRVATQRSRPSESADRTHVVYKLTSQFIPQRPSTVPGEIAEIASICRLFPPLPGITLILWPSPSVAVDWSQKTSERTLQIGFGERFGDDSKARVAGREAVPRTPDGFSAFMVCHSELDESLRLILNQCV